jgi:hypothetical protein
MFPLDPSNTATAIGGKGGAASGVSSLHPNGGAGGDATSAVTTSRTTGSASATAIATGGAGGNGGRSASVFFPPGSGGNGGQAIATSYAAGPGTVMSSATADGGSGGAGGTNILPGGSHRVGPSGSSGTAFAQSEAKNASGEALTTASAQGGGAGRSPSAVTSAGVGSVSLAPANMTPGGAVSNAIGPAGLNFGEGAMSAAYGGEPLKYEATAVFDFSTTKSEGLNLSLISDDLALVGIGFDSLELTVTLDGSSIRYQNTFSPSTAKTFFAAGKSYQLGTIAAGNNQSIELDYLLSYNTGTKALVGDGFGFAYKFADPPASGVPEPSTWAMMLVGFAGLGFVAAARAAPKGQSRFASAMMGEEGYDQIS